MTENMLTISKLKALQNKGIKKVLIPTIKEITWGICEVCGQKCERIEEMHFHTEDETRGARYKVIELDIDEELKKLKELEAKK